MNFSVNSRFLMTRTLAVALTIAISCPLPAWAAPSVPAKSEATAPSAPATMKTTGSKAPQKIVDVSLGEKGLMVGQVLDAGAKPVKQATVALYGSDGKPVIAKTDAQGAFAYQGVRGGVYYLQSGDDLRICRAWAPKTAPPAASHGVLLVQRGETVRGQYGPPPHANNFVKGSKRIFTNPLAVAGIVATAVAIPVAIHNANQDDDPATP